MLCLPENVGFDELREAVRTQMPEYAEVIGGRSSRLDIGRRPIALFDLRRLIHLLRDEFTVEITGLYAAPEAVHRFAERELKLKLFSIEDDATPETLEPSARPQDGEVQQDEASETPALPGVTDLVSALQSDEDEGADTATAVSRTAGVEAGRRTLTVHRTLRSGAAVRFDGDITVFGDVNPGAEIIATGNILVLGTLKGLCHAGASGDESSFILGFDLQPTQIRIGRKIAIPAVQESSRTLQPQVATVADGRIVTAPYRGVISRKSGASNG